MNIENKKQIATILLAVGLGIVAVVLTSQYIKNSVDQQTKLLAKEYQKQNKKSQQANAGLVKEITSLKKNMKKLEHQQKNMKFVQAEKKPGIVKGKFSVQTPPGKRAFTIMIDSLSAVGGLISAGDLVDIMGQLKVPDAVDSSKSKKVTTVLFQGIQVLAIGTNFQQAATSREIYASQQKARSLKITLALNPEEAGLLAFAQQKGKLRLFLRSPNEKQAEILQIASWDALSDYVLDKQGTELMVAPKKASIEEVKGQKSTSQAEEVKPFIQIFKAGKEL